MPGKSWTLSPCTSLNPASVGPMPPKHLFHRHCALDCVHKNMEGGRGPPLTMLLGSIGQTALNVTSICNSVSAAS